MQLVHLHIIIIELDALVIGQFVEDAIQVLFGQGEVDHELVALPIRVALEFGGGFDEVIRQHLAAFHLLHEKVESDSSSFFIRWLIVVIHDTEV